MHRHVEIASLPSRPPPGMAPPPDLEHHVVSVACAVKVELLTLPQPKPCLGQHAGRVACM